MDSEGFKHIIVTGTGRLTNSIVTNLLKGESHIQFISGNLPGDEKGIADQIADWQLYCNTRLNTERLQYLTSLERNDKADLVIAVTEEDLSIKQDLINRLEEAVLPETIIALNTESFSLRELQSKSRYPNRIIGLNWTEPAYTTLFLEIIASEATPENIIQRIKTVARKEWEKDPYVIQNGSGIRSRLMAAMAREAFFLIENGYANVQDIDRACRNDAGYYLPFAGNCRYMDLMGTYAYGFVMKDLNRELSTSDVPPSFFSSMVESGKAGMDAQAGFYDYQDNEKDKWEQVFRKFSFEIKEIIDKYPFHYLNKDQEITHSKTKFE